MQQYRTQKNVIMFYVFQILAFLAGKWRQKVLAKFCVYYFRISNDNFWENSPQGCQKWKTILFTSAILFTCTEPRKRKGSSPVLKLQQRGMGNVHQARFKKWDSSPIEKIHLKVCKRYLEVNNKASNIACRAELGRLPPLIPINIKIMKDFVCLNNTLR